MLKNRCVFTPVPWICKEYQAIWKKYVNFLCKWYLTGSNGKSSILKQCGWQNIPSSECIQIEKRHFLNQWYDIINEQIYIEQGLVNVKHISRRPKLPKRKTSTSIQVDLDFLRDHCSASPKKQNESEDEQSKKEMMWRLHYMNTSLGWGLGWYSSNCSVKERNKWRRSMLNNIPIGLLKQFYYRH